MTSEQAEKLRLAITSTFPTSCVVEEQMLPLLEAMTTHPKDRHVLAAAVAAQAPYLVTFNLTDFPETSVQPHHVHVLTPDAFLTQLSQDDAATMMIIIQKQARTLQNPPKSVAEVLSTLSQHAPTFVQHMQQQLP